MTLKIMGRKRGMTQLFDENGNAVPCTVIEVEPNVITQIKIKEIDGYSAIQTAYEMHKATDQRTIAKRCTKPLIGHYEKAKVEPRRFLQETRLEDVAGYAVGQTISVSAFDGITHVDATATSIGKGFQGPMKLHNYSGMRATHGTGPTHRHLGSTGNRSTPGRCFPGGKRASHMGAETVTVMSLKIVKIDEAENVIVVKGAVPGHRNAFVTLRQAMKKRKAK